MLRINYIIRFERILRIKLFSRFLSTSAYNYYKVAVVGGAGGIGQPLSLMLMQNPKVTRLALYDVAPTTAGIAEDLSHMNSDIVVEGGFMGKDIGHALCCAHIVVVSAGKPRMPSMSRQDLFHMNAKLVSDVVQACVMYCPWALMAFITNPVNSMVPLACEVRKLCNSPSPEKIFGVTSLDLVRASTFVAQECEIDPSCVSVPVIGGHSGTTIVPLLSQCHPSLSLTEQQITMLTKKIRNAGTEVLRAKAGAGSATLSMAYSAARFVNSLLRGLNGEASVVDYAYVKSNLKTPTFFASPVVLGQQGILKISNYEMSDYEKELMKEAIPQLEKEIQEGVDYVSMQNKE